MKTPTLYTTCLTYEELSSYTTNKADTSIRSKLYQHIATCELCTCAVNGFSVVPFASIDINPLYDKIDMKTHVKQTSAITFAQVCIIVISLFSIIAFYSVANAIQKTSMKKSVYSNKVISFAHLNVKPEIKLFVSEQQPAPVLNTTEHSVKKIDTDATDLHSTYAFQETENRGNDWNCEPFK